MRYEVIGGESCWSKHKPDCVDDFNSLPTTARCWVVLLSILLIGGGTAGCVIAANGGIYTTSSTSKLDKNDNRITYYDSSNLQKMTKNELAFTKVYTLRWYNNY